MRRKLEALFKGKDSYLGRKIERLQRKKQKAARRQKSSDKYSQKRDDEIARLRAKLGIEPETTGVAPGMTHANTATTDGKKGKQGKEGKNAKSRRDDNEFTDDDGNVEIVSRVDNNNFEVVKKQVNTAISQELNPDIANRKVKM